MAAEPLATWKMIFSAHFTACTSRPERPQGIAPFVPFCGWKPVVRRLRKISGLSRKALCGHGGCLLAGLGSSTLDC